MPPKKAATAPVGPVFPPVNPAVWSDDVMPAVPPTGDGLKAYAPTGSLKLDALSFSLLMQIPPHPALFPKKPLEHEHDAAPVHVPAAAPAKGSAKAVAEEKAVPDVRAEFVTEGPADIMSLTGWRLDAGTFAALKLALPASTGITTVRFSGCGLSVSQLTELAALLPACPSVKSVAIDFNPLPVSEVAADSKLDDADAKLPEEGSSAFSFASFILPGVTNISLRGNGISVSQAPAFAAALRTNTTLEGLNLGSNALGDEGIATLAPALRDSRTLKYLSLASNGITGASAALLTSCFTVYELSGEEAAARAAEEERLFGPAPAAPPPPDPKAKGKAAAPAALPPRPSFPAIVPVDPTTPSGAWRGVGNFHLVALDVSGNALGSAGLETLVSALLPTVDARAEAAAAAATAASAPLAKGKSTTPEPPKAVNYDEALKAGALPSSVTLSSLRLFVALNGGDATGLLETYGAEYISI